MKKLFLVSAFDQVYKELKALDSELKGKKVTFIPTASKVEEVTFYVDSGKEALSSLGMIVDELDISSASSKTIDTKLRENDIIYITGGNTFFLMQELKKTGTDKIILEEILNGKLYIGESAGAIILSKTIKYAEELDNPNEAPNLQSFDGLNIVDFYTVPHYGSPIFEDGIKNIEIKYKNKLNTKFITNNQGIIVTGNTEHLVTIK